MTIFSLGYPESEIKNFLILFLCVPGPRGMGPGRGARAPSPGPGSRARAPGPGLGRGARTRAAGPGARAPAPSPARGRGPGPEPQASFWLLEYKLLEWENGGENTHAHTLAHPSNRPLMGELFPVGFSARGARSSSAAQ